MLITKTICNSLKDSEIIAKSLEDLEYFKCLYERYENRLKRYIGKISTFDSDEINDILQNAFINIWRNINNYDDSMKLSSFLYRIVHNETISHWRKNKSSESVKEKYSINDEIEEVECFDKKSDNIREEIFIILDQMKLKYKEVLVLKFLENMDYEEISNILKIPEGTVATRINRAKKTFEKIADKQNIPVNY
jgi:RNA polymerase sigma-70 factor (ECF subfamily)